MTSIASQFSADDRDRVNRAVANAESRSSVEIVPAVATASGRYDRPEDIVGLWTALVALTVTWFILPGHARDPNSWGGSWPGWQLIALLLAVTIGFIVGATLGSRVHRLRHLFTPRQQLRDEVIARAKQVFFDYRVHRTAGATGVLIFVSLFERQAVILADQLVVDKLGQSALDELCAQLTAKLAEGSPTDAFCDVIAAAGERLAPAIPRNANDVNELPDALVLLD